MTQLALIEVRVMVILYVPVCLMRQTPHFPPSGVLEMIQKEKQKGKRKKKSNEIEKESENPLSSPHRGGGSETPTVQRREQKSGL